MSQSSRLVGGVLPGIERQPRKKLEPSPEFALSPKRNASARQLLVASLASQDDRDDAERGKASHDRRRVSQAAELHDEQAGRQRPEAGDDPPEPLQNATAVERTWVGNSSEM